MLHRTRSTFNLGEESHESKKKRPTIRDQASSNKSSVDPILGLRILIQCSDYESNIVIKPTFRSIKPKVQIPINFEESSFLKACYLCNKRLSPQKDVYMYRGDQGFCSVECRCRQIFLDEMKEIEASTKEMLASYRHCLSNGRVESGRRRRISAAA